MTFKNVGYAIALVAISTNVNAQKSAVTSAAVEYQKFEPALYTGNTSEATKVIETAKGFIDQAAQNDETKNWEKMYLYKGNIYSGLALTEGLKGEAANEEMAMGYIETAVIAYKDGYGVAKKYKGDIEDAATKNASLMSNAGTMAYKQEMFEDAAEAYSIGAMYFDAIGILDSALLFNASLCYEKAEKYAEAAEGYEKLAAAKYRGSTSAVLASQAYRKAGNIEKSKAVLENALKDFPSNKELLIELVNTSIDAGDAAGAEKALNNVIASDPNNKQLHYIIGTIYIDLQENEKAEASLNKALEIDPKYEDAQYQLGAHLVTWAGDLSTKAKQLKIGDPNYNTMIAESEGIYKRALVPLENYIANHPNDKAVLTILFQIHRNLGNSEKALEYKRRADAAE